LSSLTIPETIYALKSKLILISTFAFFFGITNAQLWKLRPLEVTAGIGLTHSFTDIGRYGADYNFPGIHDFADVNKGMALTGNVKYRFATNFAARFNLSYGYLHASDINGTNAIRSFEAKISFLEPSIAGEFYIIKNKRENAYLFIKNRKTTRLPLFANFDVYLYAGMGALIRDVSPNPALALYITDTRGITAVIPAGAGISYIFSNNVKGGIELGGRYLLKDNLESLSLPHSGNDSYGFLSVNVTWRFKTERYPDF
jgi:hypothetical protein